MSANLQVSVRLCVVNYCSQLIVWAIEKLFHLPVALLLGNSGADEHSCDRVHQNVEPEDVACRYAGRFKEENRKADVKDKIDRAGDLELEELAQILKYSTT